MSKQLRTHRFRGQKSLAQYATLDCEVDLLEGLEDWVRAEIADMFGAIKVVNGVRPGTLRFRYAADPRALFGMRGVIALYVVRSFAVPRPRALLGHQHFESLLATIAYVQALMPPGSYQTLRLSAAGEDSAVLTRLKGEFAQRTGLIPVVDEGDLLLRLRRSEVVDGWDVLVRLSPRPLATRSWRVCNMPGSLNATLAYCMVRMSSPVSDDRVLNLACGAGTLLVERLAFGRCWAMGCDTNQRALDCAHANLHAAGFGQSVRLEPWDATSIPLPDASVTTIYADLPFGQLIGSHRENEVLYPRLFAEAARLTVSGGCMVLLTHEVRLLEEVARGFSSEWVVADVVPVRVGGMTPRVYLFRRSSVFR